jgi:8-oxo-dGTP pyrophosphatase MutT (NUDIX family)
MQHPKSFTAAPAPASEAQQVGALCLRAGVTGPEVLMVTSLTTRRWVVPKGWPVPGLSAAASALHEAWEEAGVSGTVAPEPVGAYSYRKSRKGGAVIPCRVALYRVEVAGLAEAFPEAGRRDRAWVPLAGAATIAGEPELAAFLAELAHRSAPAGA